jgi:hypothetical protein
MTIITNKKITMVDNETAPTAIGELVRNGNDIFYHDGTTSIQLNTVAVGGTDLTTKGDIHGYDTEQKRIPIGSNDQVLTADSTQVLGLKWATAGGGGGLTFAKVVKSVDETINNTNTMQDDDELKVTLTANKVYFGMLFLYQTSAQAADSKYVFTVPTGATGLWMSLNQTWRQNVGTSTRGITVSVDTDGNASGGDPITDCATFFRVLMGSTAGDLQLQWAQKTAHASNAIMHKGSTLLVWEE